MVRDNRGESQIAVSTRYFKEMKLIWEKTEEALRASLQVSETEVKTLKVFSQKLEKKKEELEGVLRGLEEDLRFKDQQVRKMEVEMRRKEEEEER